MSDCKVSVLIITHNRTEELIEVVENILSQDFKINELLILENGSDKEVVELNEKNLKNYPVKLYYSVSNLGVSGGRNFLLNKSIGDYIIEIDDDALFHDKKCIDRMISYFKDNPDIGIQAFQIINYFTREITPSEFPFKDKNRNPMKSGASAWFIGAGHAFRRELIRDIGYYRDFFPWGSEEQDYAVRTIDAGYGIYYNAEIIVYHKKSPKGRISKPTKFAIVALTNRYKYAIYNFPVINILTHIIVRSTQAVLKFKNPIIPFVAMFNVIKQRKDILNSRKTISREARKKLAQLDGQLYY